MTPLRAHAMKVLLSAAVLAAVHPIPHAQDAPAMEKRHADPSTSLTLTVNGRSMQLSMADLAALPQTTMTVRNEHLNRDETYTGVAITEMLPRLGLPLTRETEQQRYHSYLRAQGTDGYFVLYSLSELDPAHHHANAIVATQVDGHALGADGRFKLVNTGDTKPARWVHNLASLTVSTIN